MDAPANVAGPTLGDDQAVQRKDGGWGVDHAHIPCAAEGQAFRQGRAVNCYISAMSFQLRCQVDGAPGEAWIEIDDRAADTDA